MAQNIVVGSVTGTGASLNVNIGFKPAYVKLWNSAAGGLCFLEYYTGMTTAYGCKIAANGDNSHITSLGITLKGETDGTTFGFMIGADTDINVVGETIYYIAMG